MVNNKIIYTISGLFISVLVCISCKQEVFIPDNKLVDILYEIYLQDAAIYNREFIYSRDSIRMYEPITEKYGYNVDDLRRTLVENARKDGRLIQIYETLKEKIIAEKEKYRPQARIEKLTENVYKGVDTLFINTSEFNKRTFSYKLQEQGVYDIYADYVFFEDDSTRNPRMSVWLKSAIYPDSILQKQEIQLVKDTVYERYSMRVTFNNLEFSQLEGCWLDFDIEKDSVVNKPLTRGRARRIEKKPETKKKQNIIIANPNIKYNFEESGKITKEEIDTLSVSAAFGNRSMYTSTNE